MTGLGWVTRHARTAGTWRNPFLSFLSVTCIVYHSRNRETTNSPINQRTTAGLPASLPGGQGSELPLSDYHGSLGSSGLTAESHPNKSVPRTQRSYKHLFLFRWRHSQILVCKVAVVWHRHFVFCMTAEGI